MIVARSFMLCALVVFHSALIVSCSGCRPGATGDVEQPGRSRAEPTLADADPKTFLKGVFNRYQNTAYYQDDGHVVLRGPSARNSLAAAAGRASTRDWQIETAPLRVRLDQRELAVDAYTARIRILADKSNRAPHPTGQPVEMTAWFNEPESSHFDAQVLTKRWQASPGDRMRLEQILSDEVLRSRLSAGLAGPPPQLEWIIAGRPMSKLFEPQSTFEWLSPARLTANDGSVSTTGGAADTDSLHRIAVTSAGERFVFWIQPRTSLIRRVELPVPDVIAASTQTDLRQWSLRLELDNATFQPPRDQRNPFDAEPGFAPVRVRSFVPLPPPPPSPILGERVELNDLRRAIPTNARVDLESLKMMLIAVPPSDADALPGWLQAWQQMMPALASPELHASHVFVITSDRFVIDSLGLKSSPIATPVQPQTVNELTRQLRCRPGSLALLSTTPRNDNLGTVLLSETMTTPVTLASTSTVMRDHDAGIDVVRRVRSDYAAIVREYENRLKSQTF